MKIWMRVIFAFLFTLRGTDAHITDPEESLTLLLKRRSLIRFGDGEFGIYQGKSIHYQVWSEELLSAFRAIKEDFEAQGNDCRYVLAVPRRFMTVSGWKLLRKRVYVACWSQPRLYFRRFFKRGDLLYADAFLFEKKNREIYSRIWESERCPQNVVFIHNSERYAELFRKTYKKDVAFVQCPQRDAFESIDDLEERVRQTINERGWTPETCMLTISAGPAGKVLVYRLSQDGFWCIDAGHCWDDPLEDI